MVDRLTKLLIKESFENMQETYSTKNKKQSINKLGMLEDIMEKYGIESLELLEHIIKKGKVINSVIEDFAKEEYDKIKQDRDTWKKACELACKTLKQVMGKPLWIGGNIPTPEVKDSDYFYQQAKNSGEDK